MNMFDAVTNVPVPVNEPPHSFAAGSAERSALEARLKQLASERVQFTMTIGGEQRLGSGETIDVVQPHRKDAVLGALGNATADDVRDAVEAARAAAPEWQRMSYDDRAAIFLKAAELLAGPWRHTLAAATMLGQSKTCYQAEIDTP
ncbi:MAG: aldehyde dehydrogenase family protein, partial [Jiangellaceae bacterium]|nr:aldehyde dehydrogenase family protein [Jiangellaceae bacterium]